MTTLSRSGMSHLNKNTHLTNPLPRPVPKFLCVKGVLFFSFWQSFFISILVAAGVITKLGPYTDSESISLGITDLLICIEMPFFAIAHNYAFSYKDFLDFDLSFVARMPVTYAFRDSFGHKDVLEDSKATLRGEGMDYREFEPSEGFMHQGDGRTRRIRAGLRYVDGGKGKYWLPQPRNAPSPIGRGVNRVISTVAGSDQAEEVHAPLMGRQADDVVHTGEDLLPDVHEDADTWDAGIQTEGYELPFGDLDQHDEELFMHSTKYLFGDYNYPVIDASSEHARAAIWDEEERVLRDERGAWFSPIRGSKGQAVIEQRRGPAWEGYGAVGSSEPRQGGSTSDAATPNPAFFGQRIHDRPTETGNLVDYDSDRTPHPNITDVRLKWTKVGRTSSRPGSGSGAAAQSQSQSHSRNNSNNNANARSSPASSPPESKGRPWPSPSVSRHSSSRGVGGDSGVHTPSPVLKSDDAVDLIVEAHEAESPLQQGPTLKRVYGDGPANAEDPHSVEARHVEEEKEEIEREAESGSPRLSPRNVLPDAEREVVTEVQAPPIHTRTFLDQDANDNPWA